LNGEDQVEGMAKRGFCALFMFEQSSLTAERQPAATVRGGRIDPLEHRGRSARCLHAAQNAAKRCTTQKLAIPPMV
jgi:hypothetical protein